MHRPYFNARVEDLENAVRGAGARVSTLKGVLAELSHRTTHKARRLREDLMARFQASGDHETTEAVRAAMEPAPVLPLQEPADNLAGATRRDGAGRLSARSSVADLHLGVRASNVLNNLGVATVGDLVAMSPADLLRTPQCGRVTVREIEQALREHGLRLGGEPPNASTVAIDEADAPVEPARPEVLSIRLSALPFSARAHSFFRLEGLDYVGQLAALTDRSVRRSPNVGRKTADELHAALRSFDIDFGVPLGDWMPEAAAAFAGLSPPDPEPSSEPDDLVAALDAVVRRTTAGERNADWTLRKHGWDGGPGCTLEELGAAAGVTRERVRQVVAKAIRALARQTRPPAALKAALKIAVESAPIDQGAFDRSLRDEGVAERGFSFSGLREAAAVYDLPFPLILSRLGDAVLALPPELEAAPQAVRRRAAKLISSRGCVHLESLASDGSGAVLSTEFVRTVLRVEGSFAPLDGEGSWWWRPGRAAAGRNRLVNNVRKVLAAAGHVTLPELRDALRRSYRGGRFAPPVRVLSSVCAALPGVCVVGHSVSAAFHGYDWQAELSPTECVMKRILRDHGPVLDRERFVRLATAEGLSQDSLAVAMSYSVILWRPAPQIYALVGAAVPPGLLDEIQRERPQSRGARLGSGWTTDGRIHLAWRLSDSHVRSGFLAVPGALKAFLQGRFDLFGEMGEPLGQLNGRDTTLMGAQKVLRPAGAEEGDVLLLILDPRTRRSEAFVGGEELEAALLSKGPEYVALTAASIRAAREAEPQSPEDEDEEA